MARTYALLKDNKVIDIRSLNEEEYLDLIKNYQNIVDIQDMAIQPQIDWILVGNKLIAPPQNPVDPIVYVSKVVMPSAAAFVNQLQTDFIAWNILNGITQLGKTDAVVGLFSKKVTIDGSNEPISLMDTMNPVCPSLTVLLKVLQYHIDHISDYSNLAPFITEARLIDLKNKVKAYLGIP